METVTVQRGKWVTRNNRVAVIDGYVMMDDSPQPGVAPTVRKVWQGDLYKADGVTPDSRHSWEQDGRFKTPLGVASSYDLVSLIEAHAEPVPAAPAA
jgi:hypothetical protein